MAVTAHYFVRDPEHRRLTLKTRLLAFRHLEGHHKGSNLAEAFFKTLQEEGIEKKVSYSDRLCTLEATDV